MTLLTLGFFLFSIDSTAMSTSYPGSMCGTNYYPGSDYCLEVYSNDGSLINNCSSNKVAVCPIISIDISSTSGDTIDSVVLNHSYYIGMTCYLARSSGYGDATYYAPNSSTQYQAIWSTDRAIVYGEGQFFKYSISCSVPQNVSLDDYTVVVK